MNLLGDARGSSRYATNLGLPAGSVMSVQTDDAKQGLRPASRAFVAARFHVGRSEGDRLRS